MRRQSLSVAIMVAAAGAYAISPVQQERAAGEAAPEVESDAGEGIRKGSPAPAPSFTPTEKIEADSAVSFPVDI